MPIISSQIVRNHNRGNGSLSIHEEHTDHTGKIHEHRYHCPLGHNVDTALVDWVAVLETALIEGEKQKVFNAVSAGANPATMTFDYLTDIQSTRSRMEAFLTGQAINVIHMLAWVQSFSVPDLNALGFTSEERGQINAREGTIDGVKSLLETDSLFRLDNF